MCIHAKSSDHQVGLIALRGAPIAEEKSYRVGLVLGQQDTPNWLRDDLCPSVLDVAQQIVIKTDDMRKMGITRAIAPKDSGDGAIPVFGAGKAKGFFFDMQRVSLDPVDDPFFRKKEAFFPELRFQTSRYHASAEVASPGSALEKIFAVKDNDGYSQAFSSGPF
jgi:hypothetical protein